MDSIIYIHPRDKKSSLKELYGYVDENDKGFYELLKIIESNMPELVDSTIVEIDKSTPIVQGGIWSHVINIRYQEDLRNSKFEYHPITTDHEFKRWIRENKYRDLIKTGMVFISLSYIIGLISLIFDRKKKVKAVYKSNRKIISRKHLNSRFP